MVSDGFKGIEEFKLSGERYISEQRVGLSADSYEIETFEFDGEYLSFLSPDIDKIFLKIINYIKEAYDGAPISPKLLKDTLNKCIDKVDLLRFL